MKAIFLDRDGVINIDTNYAHLPEHITFVDGIFDFCRAAKAKGYILIIITNQAGIGRGYYTEAQFHTLMQWMLARFEKEDCPITAYYFCPHHPEHGQGDYKQVCECRKPKPGMILKAAKEHDIDLGQSMLIGDNQTDIEAGKAVGIGELHLFSNEFPLF